MKGNDMQVANWLSSIGMEMYIEAFTKGNIDLHTLPHLDDEHLKELGISVGHRIKLKKEIEALKSDRVDDVPVEYVCKVIVVGDIFTGKTSLIQRYTDGSFDKGYKATIGVDFCLKEIQWTKNTTVSVQLWDIAGQERFANLTRMYYKEARGAFVVFDVCRQKTFEAILKWKADIDAKVRLPNDSPIPVILLANKCDLSSDKSIDLSEFCRVNGFEKWFLTSAKEDIGIDEASRFLVQRMLENDAAYHLTRTEEDHGSIVITKSDQKQKISGTCCI